MACSVAPSPPHGEERVGVRWGDSCCTISLACPTGESRRLCWVSSMKEVVGLECLVAFGEGISDDQEFSSGGDDRYLRGFAGLAHGEIIFAGERVCPARGEGGHVERGANARPSAGDLGAAAKGSALMGMRGQAGQA